MVDIGRDDLVCVDFVRKDDLIKNRFNDGSAVDFLPLQHIDCKCPNVFADKDLISVSVQPAVRNSDSYVIGLSNIFRSRA